MKAAKKFKGLIAHKSPDFLQGMLGHGIVKPPKILDHHVSRTHSDSLYNRKSLETGLATEGIHHDIEVDDNLTKKQHALELGGEQEQIHIIQHAPWPSAHKEEKSQQPP